MPAPPSGTVAFRFTDIEGSVRMALHTGAADQEFEALGHAGPQSEG
jgi:hypothetical protein